jgi:hypothetical protein
MNYIKNKIRSLIMQLKWATDDWVCPEELYVLIDECRYSEAKAIVEQQRKIYPHDPEITKASTLISFQQKIE